MKRFTKTQKALGALTDTILGDSTNVVRKSPLTRMAVPI